MAVGVRRFTPSRVSRGFGAFAVPTLRAIGKIRRGEWTGPEAAAHFDQWPEPMACARQATMTRGWWTC